MSTTVYEPDPSQPVALGAAMKRILAFPPSAIRDLTEPERLAAIRAIAHVLLRLPPHHQHAHLLLTRIKEFAS